MAARVQGRCPDGRAAGAEQRWRGAAAWGGRHLHTGAHKLQGGGAEHCQGARRGPSGERRIRARRPFRQTHLQRIVQRQVDANLCCTSAIVHSRTDSQPPRLKWGPETCQVKIWQPASATVLQSGKTALGSARTARGTGRSLIGTLCHRLEAPGSQKSRQTCTSSRFFAQRDMVPTMGTAISSDAEVPRHSAIAPAFSAELRLELATEGTWWYSSDACGPKHFRPGHCVEACCNRFQEQAFWWSAILLRSPQTRWSTPGTA